MAKTAFENLARNSHYVADPDDLMIIGGAILPPDERGPLDTAHKKGEHDLWDERLTNVVTDAEVANVDTFGVIEPILIAKDPVSGEPMVVAGRQRVRRARRANILRSKRGELPIKIDCKITRATGTNLITLMIAENEGRKDDGPLVRLEKAKRLMARGVSEDDAATAYSMDVKWFRELLAYDDTAVPEVRQAVTDNVMSPTAAVEMVKRSKTAYDQRKALEEVKKASKGKPASVRDVTEATKRASGQVSEEGAGLIPTRRELGRVLKQLAEYTDTGVVNEAIVLVEDETSDITPEQRHVVDAYYVGAKRALELVFGKCEDAELLKMLAKARKA